MEKDSKSSSAVRRVLVAVMLLNLGYFVIEFGVAGIIDSVALFADSIDFLEDAVVNALILIGLSWSVRGRSRLGMALALILLLPGAATLWTAWHQWHSANIPEPVALSVTGLGAFAVNLSCAVMLARVRHAHGALTKAAFLSARNDLFANIVIVLAGGLTAWTRSQWPDLVVGCGIFVMNLDAAREIFQAARNEHRTVMNAEP